MKRIVIDARESGSTTGRYVDKLIEYLHKLGPGYEIVLLAKPARIKFLSALAPNFEVVACPIKEFTFAEQIQLKRQIKGLHPDLVFFPMVQQPVFYRGPVVTAMQDLTTVRFRNPAKNWFVFTIKQAVYKWVNKRVAHKSRQIITPSQFVRQDVANYTGVSPSKITAIHDSADKIIESAQPVAGLAGKSFLLSVGRPSANKNLNRLVDAFEALNRLDLYLVFAGKTDAEFVKLQKYAGRQTSGQRIVFTDFVSEGQLRWLYENAQAYVFPSLSEGFGLPGLEAMHYDLPVVSSNATCLPEVYGSAALYFDPLDVSDMASKIAQVLDDPKLAKDQAAQGQQQLKKYSWARMAEQTLEVFEKVLK